MEIKFYGQACFLIEGKGATVLIDPFSETIGLNVPQWKADVVLVSLDGPGYDNVQEVSGEPRVFSWPGEYEVKGVHFRMLPSFLKAQNGHAFLENKIAIIHFNGVKICHLGAQDTKLTEAQIEQIGDVDILFLPVGGKKVLSPKEAKAIAEEIEPRVIIPMLYATGGNVEDLGPLSAFLSEMGAASIEPQASFKVKKSELPDDNSMVMVLEA